MSRSPRTGRTTGFDAARGWVEAQLGAAVLDVRPLPGGMTSTVLALTDEYADRWVLRLVDREPWRTHGAGLVAREAEVQRLLEDGDVPAPRSVAVAPDAGVVGHPAHLMSLLPGAADSGRGDDAARTALAGLLVAIHAVRPPVPPREYQSWAWPAKWVVPDWAERPEVWRRAFDVLAVDPPAYGPTFLHRDFHAGNVLWQGDAVSGVVDWVETSWGPAWLDVAHCRTNLAVRHGPEVGAAFAEAYVAAGGERGDAYWDVMDAVGFLPPPGRQWRFPPECRRDLLEAHLAGVLEQVG